MKLYVYNKCSTCRNAIRFLEKRNVQFVRKEISETPPSVSELQIMLKYLGGNLKKLFNTSGLLYREMQLSEKLKNMSQSDSILLLSQQGMLVKRPFLIKDGFGLVGFNEAEWSKHF
jgi:arsenate reductase (glutaredoxin)